jgi:hypothetical protein
MQFGLVKEDAAILADGTILLLGALLCVVALLLIYILTFGKSLHAEVGRPYRVRLTVLLLFLLCGGALYVAPLLSSDQLVVMAVVVAATGVLGAALVYFGWVRLVAFSVLFLLWAVTVYAAHVFARDQFLLSAIVALTAGTSVVTAYYFTTVRPLVSVHDNRIAYTMLFVGALGLLAIGALLALWHFRDHVRLETMPTLGVANIVQMAGLVISAIGIVFTYLMRSEQANRTANQQIYQTLELQSVQLFRFEADHADLVERLWYGEVPEKLVTPELELPPRDEAELYVLRQYVCQMLNLFEMAYRFRVRGIMEAEVFGSWVIWMWELCESDVFCAFWKSKDNLPANYVKGFSEAMTFGVDLRRQRAIPPPGELAAERERKAAEARKAQFFDRLAKDLGCPEIKEWLK